MSRFGGRRNVIISNPSTAPFRLKRDNPIVAEYCCPLIVLRVSRQGRHGFMGK